MGKEGRKENTSVSSLTCKLNYLKHFVNDCGHISSNRTKSEPSWMPVSYTHLTLPTMAVV